MELKQVILVRIDLKMPKGKMAAQCAHASVDAAFKTDKKLMHEWITQGMKKVVLRVDSLKELLEYKRKADDAGLVTGLITDAGKTVFNHPETTCLAIGPYEEKKIDTITGDLRLVE